MLGVATAASAAGDCPVEIKNLLSTKPPGNAGEIARAPGIRMRCVSPKAEEIKELADKLALLLKEAQEKRLVDITKISPQQLTNTARNLLYDGGDWAALVTFLLKSPDVANKHVIIAKASNLNPRWAHGEALKGNFVSEEWYAKPTAGLPNGDVPFLFFHGYVFEMAVAKAQVDAGRKVFLETEKVSYTPPGGRPTTYDVGSDVNVRDPKLAINCKQVTGESERALARNLRKAVTQLEGANEVILPGMTRHVQISIVNPKNPHFDLDAAQLREALDKAFKGDGGLDGGKVPIEVITVINGQGVFHFVLKNPQPIPKIPPSPRTER